MNSKKIKRGVIIAAAVGIILVPTGSALAADAVSFLGLTEKKQTEVSAQRDLRNVAAELKEHTKQEKTLKIESAEEIKLNEMLNKFTFVAVGEEGFAPVQSEMSAEAAAVGKVYADSIVKVVERAETWTKISSGSVTGYVETDRLIVGKAAVAHAKAQLTVKFPETELTTLDKETIDASFSVGETLEEEAARIAAAEAARIAEEQARLAQEQADREAAQLAKGQAVVDYARQFLGNRYVYGGTSLTRGVDCSGFVMRIYEKFGFSMAHSSYAQRRVGYGVSYSEAQPGDIICYPGHVGIYVGDGKIIHASDERSGIKISSATYTTIVAVRRMF
ncbi:MAG: C40 family peptidase [Faecalimonas sp.]|nr:C40 family peptidase [Faecalimonas sp.]